jgi:hypothetical protein
MVIEGRNSPRKGGIFNISDEVARLKSELSEQKNESERIRLLEV